MNNVDTGAEEWRNFITAWYYTYKETGKTSREVLEDLRRPYLEVSVHAPEELAKKLTKFEGPGDAKIVGVFLHKKLNLRCKVNLEVIQKDGSKKTINGLMLIEDEDKNRKIRVWKVKEAIDHAL